MVPTRRRLLSVIGPSILAGLGGCLDDIDAGPSGTSSPVGQCPPTAPPDPVTGNGLPDPRPYPDGPPELTDETVASFVERYERAFRYNAMLAGFQAEGTCLKYLELYVVDDETSIAQRDGHYEVTVTVQGSYTGAPCATESGTDTPTPAPHADLPQMPANYRVDGRALLREETTYECW